MNVYVKRTNKVQKRHRSFFYAQIVRRAAIGWSCLKALSIFITE